MRKIISALLVLALCLGVCIGLVACGGNGGSKAKAVSAEEWAAAFSLDALENVTIDFEVDTEQTGEGIDQLAQYQTGLYQLTEDKVYVKVDILFEGSDEPETMMDNLFEGAQADAMRAQLLQSFTQMFSDYSNIKFDANKKVYSLKENVTISPDEGVTTTISGAKIKLDSENRLASLTMTTTTEVSVGGGSMVSVTTGSYTFSKYGTTVIGGGSDQPGDEGEGLSYEEFMAAELGEQITLDAYVQATQSWWDNKITVYAADEGGAYFFYEMTCSEDDAAKLTPGTKIIVTGEKAEYAGEVELMYATFEFAEDESDTYIAPAFNATDVLGTDGMLALQNKLVRYEGLTVVSVEYKNGEPGDDIYVTVSNGLGEYTFTVELYLTGPDTEVYQTVANIVPGNIVDIEGFVYWYNGVDTHITSIEVKSENTPAGDTGVTYEEFMAAELGEQITLDAYVQATQSWWDNKITVYAADEGGAYFFYEMTCSEEDAAKLTPGTKIIVTGEKAEYAGEVELMYATFEFAEDESDTYLAPAFNATDVLGTDGMLALQNKLVRYEGLTVVSVEYKNGEPGDDIYVTVSNGLGEYTFTVELYLTGPDTEVYQAFAEIGEGDIIDLVGFVYWYNGVDTHITAVRVVESASDDEPITPDNPDNGDDDGGKLPGGDNEGGDDVILFNPDGTYYADAYGRSVSVRFDGKNAYFGTNGSYSGAYEYVIRGKYVIVLYGGGASSFVVNSNGISVDNGDGTTTVLVATDGKCVYNENEISGTFNGDDENVYTFADGVLSINNGSYDIVYLYTVENGMLSLTGSSFEIIDENTLYCMGLNFVKGDTPDNGGNNGNNGDNGGNNGTKPLLDGIYSNNSYGSSLRFEGGVVYLIDSEGETGPYEYFIKDGSILIDVVDTLGELFGTVEVVESGFNLDMGDGDAVTMAGVGDDWICTENEVSGAFVISIPALPSGEEILKLEFDGNIMYMTAASATLSYVYSWENGELKIGSMELQIIDENTLDMMGITFVKNQSSAGIV